jgi:hypothetical protein
MGYLPASRPQQLNQDGCINPGIFNNQGSQWRAFR